MKTIFKITHNWSQLSQLVKIFTIVTNWSQLLQWLKMSQLVKTVTIVKLASIVRIAIEKDLTPSSTFDENIMPLPLKLIRIATPSSTFEEDGMPPPGHNHKSQS